MKNVVLFALIVTSLVFLCCARGTKSAKVIEVKAGQDFTIALEANATTGYQWQFAETLDTSMVQLISSDYVPEETERVGAGGKQVWIFKALKAGKTSISFKYVRPWEKNQPPEMEESFAVTIKK